MTKTSVDIQYFILKFLLSVLAAIPRNIFIKLAVPIGYIWYIVDRRHRTIARENMRIAYGNEKSPQTIRKLIMDNFVQITRVALELPSLMKMNQQTVDSYVIYEGVEHLNAAIERKNGIIILSAHFGNWEAMVRSWPLKTSLPCNGVVRPLDYEPMERLQAELRSSTGGRLIDKNNAKDAVIEVLQKNEVVGILLDQCASWYEGVFVPFFGKLACTSKGVASLALLLNSTVLPVFSFRQKDGRYKIVISSPMSIIRTGDFEKDIMLNTEQFNREIEKNIRKAPDHWFWVHRRWRIIDIPDKHKHKLENAKLYFRQHGGIV